MGGCSQLPEILFLLGGSSQRPTARGTGKQEEQRLCWNLGYPAGAPKVFYVHTQTLLNVGIFPFMFSFSLLYRGWNGH